MAYIQWVSRNSISESGAEVDRLRSRVKATHISQFATSDIGAGKSTETLFES